MDDDILKDGPPMGPNLRRLVEKAKEMNRKVPSQPAIDAMREIASLSAQIADALEAGDNFKAAELTEKMMPLLKPILIADQMARAVVRDARERDEQVN